MSIVWECPNPKCRKRWKMTRKACSCGINYKTARRAKPPRIKFYPVVYNENGNPKYLSLGTMKGVSPYSLRDAKLVEGKWRAAKREGTLDIFEHKAESSWTVNDLCNWFLQQATTQRKKNLPTCRSHLKQLCQRIGHKRLSSLTTHDLEEYHAQRMSEGKATGTANEEVFHLRGAVSSARKAKKVSIEVVEAARGFHRKPTAPRKRTLTGTEFKAIHDAADVRLRHLLLFGYWTGARTREALGLQWEQVDLDGNVIRIKNLKQRVAGDSFKVVPIADALRTVIEKLPRTGKVFHDGWKAPDDLVPFMRKAVLAAGLIYGREDRDQGITFSSLRHTMERDLRLAGVHLHVASAILGHSTGTMASWYDQIDAKDLAAAIKALEKYRASIAQHPARKVYPSIFKGHEDLQIIPDIEY